MYPVAIGTNDPKMFPPNIKKLIARPTISEFHTRSFVRAIFNDSAPEIHANEIEMSNKSRYSFTTMLVSRTTPDNNMNTISSVRRLPCLTAS
jgi:hypothetical protein